MRLLLWLGFSRQKDAHIRDRFSRRIADYWKRKENKHVWRNATVHRSVFDTIKQQNSMWLTISPSKSLQKNSEHIQIVNTWAIMCVNPEKLPPVMKRNKKNPQLFICSLPCLPKSEKTKTASENLVWKDPTLSRWKSFHPLRCLALFSRIGQRRLVSVRGAKSFE